MGSMKLSQLTDILTPDSVSEANIRIGDIEITDVVISSQLVKQGSLFIALAGTKVDGHDFIADAIERGAAVVVCERIPKELIHKNICIQVPDTHLVAGPIASRFFGDPSHKLKVIGVTGTNGKTTTTTLLYKLFENLGYKVGLISTIQNYIHKKELPATHTTPDPITLHTLFRDMVDAGCEYCFMEVSSHALDQKRVVGIEFTGAIFTNATHDHLDYHMTFEAYLSAKQGLFDMLHDHMWALANADDENGEFMLQNTKAMQHYYGLTHEDHHFSGKINFEGTIIENSFNGLVMDINGKKLVSNLVGVFNAYNLLAIFGAAQLLDEDADLVIEKMGELESADGRFQMVRNSRGTIGIIDYAHTPDALENVLATLRDIKKTDQRIITVIGCGGNRDTLKRPVMARIARELSDFVVLTADNPRGEEPLAIIESMKHGLDNPKDDAVFEVIDRAEAIENAVSLAGDNDIILIAGKGHETYQEIKGEKFHFNDREVLEEKLRQVK